MRMVATLAIAAGMMTATAARADDKRDFELCDGRTHPGKQPDGMRGTVGSSPWQMVGGDRNVEVAAACTRALASPRLLPTQTLRRVHLLRARAAAQLSAGEIAPALADIDTAERAAGALSGDRFYARSMGVSLTLLRALAQARKGDVAAAAPLARTAMAARPYALEVQQIGSAILQLDPAAPAGAAAELMRIDPAAADVMLIREAAAGRFANVVALRGTAPPNWPTERLAPLAFAVKAPAANQLLAALVTALDTAYARAATGDVAGARRDLAEARTRLDAAMPAPDGAPTVGAVPANTLRGNLDRFVDQRAKLVEARIAIVEKRPADALAAVVAAPLPRNAASADLLVALKAALPADKAAMVPDAAPFAQAADAGRADTLTGIIPAALIAPETPRSVVDYAQARPNILGALVAGALTMGTSLLGGINRTDGFRSTANPDGTTTVEFLGNTPSQALVQEMTLLRAAEVTKAAGKPAFVIAKRNDYQRRMVQTQYGREISSTPTGFKTELTIRPVNTGTDPARALDATAVIDALGPLYYEEKKRA